MATPENTQRKILFTVLVVLLVGLLFLVYLIYGQLKQAEAEVGQTPSASEAPSTTSTTNVQVSYNLTSVDENIDSVKDVANKFMQAKEDRSYDGAKVYMTDELKDKWNQDSFAGTSSPSMDRFEITSTGLAKVSDTYRVDVTSYWLLNGSDSETIKYSLEITKKDNDFLVSKFDQV